MKYNQEKKADLGKLRMDLIPVSAFTSISRVLSFGAHKYEENTWQEVERKRYVAAALRHFVAYMEDPHSVDTESGLKHIEHCLANIVFLNDMEENHYGD